MNNTIEYKNIHENRKYKDSLFCLVFSDKESLLDLYNAINNTTYTDSDALEVNTLAGVLYMTMKNDVSFVVDCSMNLYEHQSSANENMPLRGFFYFAKTYSAYVTENGLDIYNSKLQKLPTPHYIVFYNGLTNEPDERIMRLSEAFIKEGGCLECVARLLNINYGHNKELMERCRRLEEYSIFIARVRKRMSDNHISLKQAITQTMEECISDGILYDILTKQRDEVFGVLLSTFNKELYEKNLKQNAYENGQSDKLIQQIQKKLAKGISVETIAIELEEPEETILQLIKIIENNKD